jgi:hypothetical protein
MVPPNSAANSLPTPFWCPEFRCRTVWRSGTQDLAIARLFGDGEVIFGCRMRIFPCRQGKRPPCGDRLARLLILLAHNGIDGRIDLFGPSDRSFQHLLGADLALSDEPGEGDGVVLAIVNFTRRFTKRGNTGQKFYLCRWFWFSCTGLHN